MTAPNRQRVADEWWKYCSEKFYKVHINRYDSEALIYHPTPLAKLIFLAALIIFASALVGLWQKYESGRTILKYCKINPRQNGTPNISTVKEQWLAAKMSPTRLFKYLYVNSNTFWH